MKHWTPEPFTHQNIEMLMAFRRIQRFRVKNLKDFKSGLFVHMRQTLSLDLTLLEIVKVDGKADKKPYKLFHHDRRASPPHGMRFGKTASKGVDGRYSRTLRKDTWGFHVGTLMRGTNHAYVYNTETLSVMKEMVRLGRFQQHCIYNNRRYTEEEYANFQHDVSVLHWQNDETARMIDETIKDRHYA